MMDKSAARWGMWLAASSLLVGCAVGPPVPDWQLNAHRSVERATQAQLEGNRRVAEHEWHLALQETARTARLDRVARVELVHCAVRQAALDLSPCAGFAARAQDASAADQAYARYLQGQALTEDVALLPPAHRPVAQLMLGPPAAAATAPTLRAIDDPLARLVASSSLLRGQRLDLAGIAVAVDTASDQGWRRPLLAWLMLQAQEAERAGDAQLAQLARRRADLLGAGATTGPAPKTD